MLSTPSTRLAWRPSHSITGLGRSRPGLLTHTEPQAPHVASLDCVVAARLSLTVPSSVNWEHPPRTTDLALWSTRCWPEAVPQAESRHMVRGIRHPLRQPPPSVPFTGVLWKTHVGLSVLTRHVHTSRTRQACAHAPVSAGGTCLPRPFRNPQISAVTEKASGLAYHLCSLYSLQEMLGPGFPHLSPDQGPVML